VKRISVGGLATKRRTVQVLVRHGFTLIYTVISSYLGHRGDREGKGYWGIMGTRNEAIRGPGNQVLGAFGRSAAADSMKVVLEIERRILETKGRVVNEKKHNEFRGQRILPQQKMQRTPLFSPQPHFSRISEH
jgi:hypothetical protein